MQEYKIIINKLADLNDSRIESKYAKEIIDQLLDFMQSRAQARTSDIERIETIRIIIQLPDLNYTLNGLESYFPENEKRGYPSDTSKVSFRYTASGFFKGIIDEEAEVTVQWEDPDKAYGLVERILGQCFSYLSEFFANDNEE